MPLLNELQSPKKYFTEGIPEINNVAPHHFPNLKSNFWPGVDETKQIQYRLNSLGYRDDEFYWREDHSIWLLGHSDTVGVGVEESQTYAGIIRQYHDTLNLGVAGAGWDTVARILCSGLKKYKPRAIVIVMSDWVKFRREAAYDNYFRTVLPGLPSEYLPYKDYYNHIDEENSNYSVEKNLELISHVCRRVETKIFNFEDRNKLVEKFPSADGTHIGKEIHRAIAEEIIECLNLKN